MYENGYQFQAVMARRGLTHGIETYQLDVDLSKLMFTHHPLFSKENVLAMRLMELYKHYLQRAQENMADYYEQKVGTVCLATSISCRQDQI